MLTKYIFSGIVVAVILQRLVEVRSSDRHKAEILKRGGQEHGDNLLGAVKVLQVSWWIAMIAEVWYLDRPFMPVLAVVALTATIAGQILRYLSMQALKWRWTLPIMTVPGMPVVTSGVYRYLRHPNWLGVILEIAFLPLIHSAYLTAIAFSLANAWLMSKRIQTEERALAENSNYAAAFAGKPRFFPGISFSKLADTSQ
ncbi:Isoprenylcysteine carboxyl methyltransferase [Hyella patelloides LEGE 07179]|uniref:Isoprenylcysteine carboxyl methyltransferase n=1 Tax=Hyella patelloides LEGE 07179 TaxID=945734 RepID=A0A563VKG3_9CYAN|nr:isoprenylcysteine carboxylmethyltransferase family protein [Hyella patelloides]VEP11902.1 Isoprenylcysteine carboxyl methyltransferase [Hyella patelloides LEGE 07179]